MLSTHTLSLLAISTVAYAASTTNKWATYPLVPKTASINGFADPIYNVIPECAKECVDEDTGSTPCPYWDTGCLCVMSNWSGAVAQCIAEKCQGGDVESFTAVATSKCSAVGVPSPYWFIPDSAESSLAAAAAATTTDDTTAEPTATSTVEESSKAVAPETSEAEASTQDTTEALETTEAPTTKAPISEAPITEAPSSTAEGAAASEVASEAVSEGSSGSAGSASASSSSKGAAPTVATQDSGAATRGVSLLAGLAALISLI